jgi:hypothetical protein
MSRTKTLCTVLFAVLALAAAFAATSAMAELPDVHILSGEEYGKEGVKGEGTLENAGVVVGTLETVLGESLTATAINVKATLKELSALGPGTLIFKGVTEPRTKTLCLTTSNTKVEGEVILPGEYHVVTNAGLTTPMVLILFEELTVECNSKKLKIKVKAPALIKLEGIKSGTDVLSYGLVANCTAKGKQELTEYVNDELKEGKEVVVTKAFLLANFGLGLEQACERTTKELTVKSEKMLDFLF